MEAISEAEEQRCVIRAIKTHKKALAKNIESSTDPCMQKVIAEKMHNFDAWMNECKAKLYDSN